ncbi:MAG: urea transporter [Deltaproteobacteria bacterium]|jgi:Na+/proline symporter
MRTLDASTGWIVLAFFSVAWVFLGWLWGKRANSFDDRMLAGRNVGLALGMATAMATWITSNTTMAAPQLAYQLGVWGMVGYSLGAVGLILFAPMAERIKHLMPNGYTSGDFVRTRFGRPAWFVFLLISFFYGLGWLVSMGMAGGVLLNALTGIEYHVGMIVITVVCVGYTLLGGLHAVIGTDYIQSVVILIGLIVAAIAVYTQVGIGEIFTTLETERVGLLDMLAPASIMFLFNNLLFGLGEIFHSNVWWSRALALREGVGFKAYFLAGVAWLPVPVVAGSIALAAPALGLNIPALDMVGPMVIGNLLGTTGAVLILVIVFCSLASSLDSLLAATADLLVEDVYRGLIAPTASSAQLERASRMIIVALGVLAIALCWGRVTTLAEMIQFTGAFVGATIWPIAAGLYWEKTNPNGAVAGMVLGIVAGLTAYFTVGFYTAALAGAGVSMVCVVVSTLVAPRAFDWSEMQRLRAPEATS